MSSAFDWAPGGCCCKAIFELWPSLHGDDTFGVINLTKLVGEPSNTSGEFEITDVDSETWYAALAIDDVVYMVEQDSTPTTLYVTQYDHETGADNWSQTSSNTLNSALARGSGYWTWGMTHTASDKNQFACSPTQLFFLNTLDVFSSSGVTAGATPNTTSLPQDDDSADWVIDLFSSHDFPKVLCHRTYWDYDSATVTYDYTDEQFGTYFHHYIVEWDEIFEIGIGTYDYASTGEATGVDVIYTKTVTRTDNNVVIFDSSPTPPSPDPTFDDLRTDPWDLFPDPNTVFNVTNLIFSSYDYDGSGGYIVAFRLNYTDSGTEYNLVRSYVNGSSVVSGSYSGGTLSDYPVFHTCAYVHGTPVVSGHAHALLTWVDDTDQLRLTGYTESASEVIDEDLENFGIIRSVSDHYFWLQTEWDMANDAPDGRNWSNASYSGSPTDEIWNWIVRLDSGEWEPIRDETTATAWQRLLTFLEGGGGVFGNINATSRDMVKTSNHPYGPPLTTYGTTPP